MKKSVLLVAMSLLVSATMLSCGEKNPFPGYTPTGSGLYYKQVVAGTGDMLEMGDVIKLRLAYYLGDSLLFTTENMPEPAYDQVHESVFQGDLYEGFRMMHVGDSMSFMINADSVFLKQFRAPSLPEFIQPGSFLRWEVTVDEALSEAEFQQKKMEEAAAMLLRPDSGI